MASAACVQLPADSVVLISTSSRYSSRKATSPAGGAAHDDGVHDDEARMKMVTIQRRRASFIAYMDPSLSRRLHCYHGACQTPKKGEQPCIRRIRTCSNPSSWDPWRYPTATTSRRMVCR